MLLTNQSSWNLSIIFHLLQKHGQSEHWYDEKLNLTLCSLSFVQQRFKFGSIRKFLIPEICAHFPSFLIVFQILSVLESSRPEVFCKKGLLKNFAKFTGTHITQVFSVTPPVATSEYLILKIIGIIQKIITNYRKMIKI